MKGFLGVILESPSWEYDLRGTTQHLGRMPKVEATRQGWPLGTAQRPLEPGSNMWG